jgi:hypothetical protein
MTLGRLEFVKFSPNGIVKGLTIDLDAARAIPTPHGRLPSGVIVAILVQRELGYSAVMPAWLVCEIEDRRFGSKRHLEYQKKRHG